MRMDRRASFRSIALQGGGRAIARALVSIFMLATPVAPAIGQLVTERLYVGVGRPIVVRVEPPTELIGTASIRLMQRQPLEQLASAEVQAGGADLSMLFPSLWTDAPPRLLYAQLFVGESPVGAPLVLQPLLTEARATDQLTARVLQALAAQDRDALGALLELPAGTRRALSQQVAVTEAPAPVFSGLRVYADADVLLETSAGPLRLSLRPDRAPNTAFHVRTLVEGGFYDGVVFHRVINADARGRPFLVQTGDPTGRGSGGPGFSIDFEASVLRHDFGVVSLARQADDPNSAGSQFFICLGREACAALDGQYASFAQVVEGARTLATIAAVPVAPPDAGGEPRPGDRPFSPPTIHAARLVPAPALGTGPGPITPEAARTVDR